MKYEPRNNELTLYAIMPDCMFSIFAGSPARSTLFKASM